ncbi:TetR/AcrR family transcriptional regulator [Nocardioides sp. ChNu-153]|uniref:TetR/AcrR family transcriptional regulator n=1 Tax=unclassified Nocardioides TaxID=2615069 RepID=UPI002406ABA5|nr:MULTISPECIES: TetR/AcrR family transcriptional regulator [unclassified Nocardioides]MDF9718013.1 TetR/AcrR family transcriptional regulator [Nocardioides sp. ChNu-99]MDN7121319.1 TetR/AcrR family transcriptional regulator [Nocardioides sp. ChNu-153]
MPKISGESLSAHREQIRERVFAAFVELVGERSFEAITMAQLAARAGVGRTSIYHHFPDKDAVVVAFASHETTRYLETLEAVLADAGSPTERLRRYLHHHLAEGEQFHLGLGPQVYGLLSDSSLREIREHVVAVETVLRDIVDEGVASGEFAVRDVDAVLPLVHACLNPRQVPADVVVEFVLGGISAR